MEPKNLGGVKLVTHEFTINVTMEPNVSQERTDEVNRVISELAAKSLREVPNG